MHRTGDAFLFIAIELFDLSIKIFFFKNQESAPVTIELCKEY